MDGSTAPVRVPRRGRVGGGPGGRRVAAPPGRRGAAAAEGARPTAGCAAGEARTEDERRYARDGGRAAASRTSTSGPSVQSVATASSLGDYFQYVIDRPVDLARQKSALLPIVNKDVEGKRVSIYNPAVQAKHPLLGPASSRTRPACP